MVCGSLPSGCLRTWGLGEVAWGGPALALGLFWCPNETRPSGDLVAHFLVAHKGFHAPSRPTLHGPSPSRYLKEFRTEQCPLFVQHKCTQHRPYTCFHWHFVNQRRRRSIRRRDGTFNYSPDVYCTKYDEATGLCPEGDE